jgi:hypothetical protein
MDAAFYEDLAGRLYGLVIRLSDRLPADQVQWLHHVTEVGEYGLALEDMAAMLPRAKIAITDQAGFPSNRGDFLIADSCNFAASSDYRTPVHSVPWRSFASGQGDPDAPRPWAGAGWGLPVLPA